MLSFQIKEEIVRILKSFDDAKYFFDCLDSISSTFPLLSEYLQDIVPGGDKAGTALNHLRTHLSTIRNKITDVKPRSFFSSIEKLRSEIKKAKQYGFNGLSQINEIETKLNNFSQTYESYIESYTPQSAANMVFEARELLPLLDGFKKGLKFYLVNIDSSIPDLEAGRELSIVLSSSMTLSEFITKLKAVEQLYNELCYLTKISVAEFPIQILKIESGSLWARVFGNSKVIALLTSIIESGVGFIYRNYTTEGMITSLPTKVEAIESVLQLSAKLESQGINVEELKDHINKASVLLSKELNKLISGQPEIIINNNKLSIGDELQKRLIQTNELLKIDFENGKE